MKYRLYELLRCFLTGILKKNTIIPARKCSTQNNHRRDPWNVEPVSDLCSGIIIPSEMGKSNLPPGNLTVCHGKIHPFLIGKPSMSMGHLYHGYVSHNQRVLETILIPISCGSPFFVGSIPMIRC
jgi:hypothetical protein